MPKQGAEVNERAQPTFCNRKRITERERDWERKREETGRAATSSCAQFHKWDSGRDGYTSAQSKVMGQPTNCCDYRRSPSESRNWTTSRAHVCPMCSSNFPISAPQRLLNFENCLNFPRLAQLQECGHHSLAHWCAARHTHVSTKDMRTQQHGKTW